MCREAKRTRPLASDAARIGRRVVLRAGAGVAAGLLAGAAAPVVRAAPPRQEGGFIQGGRWIEAEGYGLAQVIDPSQYIVFATEIPFDAVAPSWSGDADPGGVVELLWSPDGVTWSEPLWIEKATHGGPPDRDGRHIGALTATPGGTFLQYRTYDGNDNLAALPGFELDYIDASTGATLQQVANPATTPVFSPPPVISRAGWGADEALRYTKAGKEIFPVEYQAVERVIIHHADTANFNDPVLEMRSIYYFHAITRGWGDIAYNYLVDFLGNVYEGRTGGETAIGCHAEGYNRGSCGICLMGRFFEEDITPEMHNAVVWISSWAARDLDPTASGPFLDIPDLPTICGHRDVNNTSCPGEEFYTMIQAVRPEARRVIKGRDDPEPPPAEWHPGMHVVTTAEGTSLRQGPGLDFEKVANVAVGESLTVLQGPATNDDMIWYEVEGPSLSGWIAGSLLTPDPNATAANLPPPATVVPEPPPADASTPPPAVVEEPPPAEPPTGAEAIGGGDDRDNGNGGGRDDGGRDGKGKERRQDAWPVYEIGTTVSVIGGALNLRADPGLGSAILTELWEGAIVTVIGGPVETDGIVWRQVMTADGLTGWCDGTYLQSV